MPKQQVSEKQIDKFKEAAREAETDDSEEYFDKIIKRIAKAHLQNKSEIGKKTSD